MGMIVSQEAQLRSLRQPTEHVGSCAGRLAGSKRGSGGLPELGTVQFSYSTVMTVKSVLPKNN